MANKSDELATKEMPFRCYVGYDSHEDITFEVRRVFVDSVSFFASLGGGRGRVAQSRAKRRHPTNRLPLTKMISLALFVIIF